MNTRIYAKSDEGENSHGIYVNGGLDSENCDITAIAGTADEWSCGILSGEGDIVVDGGRLEAISGTGCDKSTGICMEYFDLVANGSTVIASGRSAAMEEGTPKAINGGRIILNGIGGASQAEMLYSRSAFASVGGSFAVANMALKTDATGSIAVSSIDSASVNTSEAQNLLIFGQNSTVKGNVTLSESVVVPAGVTVTVPADASLTLGSGVTLTLEETAQLVVENKASIKGSGKIAGPGNVIYGNAPAADAPAADTPAADTPAQDIEIPQTGDEAMPMLSAMMLVLTGAAMIALRRSARSRG